MLHCLLFGEGAHGLLQQRDRGDQVEDPPADPDHLLGDPHRGEGLARAAGHDQLPAVGAPEPGPHRLDRLLLVLPRGERLGPPAERLRRLLEQVRPVHGPFRQVGELEHLDLGPLPPDHRQRVRPPSAPGVHDHAGGEVLLPGGGEERVEVALRDPGVRPVALALDGAEAAVALFGDEIHPGVPGRAPEPDGPVGPPRDRGEPVPVERILQEVSPDQPLEERPLLGRRAGPLEDLVQDCPQVVHRPPLPHPDPGGADYPRRAGAPGA